MNKKDMKSIIYELNEETLRDILIDIVNDIYHGNNIDLIRLELIIDVNR
jgi:hypothetical protein